MKGLVAEFHKIKRGVFRFEGENIDANEKILEFTHSSRTRDLLYYISLDVDTLEVSCPCEWAEFKVKGWDYFLLYATRAEQEGFDPHTMHRKIGPQITRNAAGLCSHARRVQQWVRRRGIELAIEKARTPEEAKRLEEFLLRNCD